HERKAITNLCDIQHVAIRGTLSKRRVKIGDCARAASSRHPEQTSWPQQRRFTESCRWLLEERTTRAGQLPHRFAAVRLAEERRGTSATVVAHVRLSLEHRHARGRRQLESE